MPLNRKTLKWSLQSIIGGRERRLTYDTYRGYVVLYNNTMKYIKDNMGESETLKELYHKFPIIELKEFNKPVDYLLSFLFWLPRIFSKYGSWNPMDYNPRWKMYRDYIHDQQGLIYTLASEVMMRVGE